MSQPVPLCSQIMTHRNGKTCGAPALRGRKFCYHHDPDRAERKPRRAAAARAQTFDSISAMQRELTDVVHFFLEGKLDSRRAGKIIQAVEVAMRSYGVDASNL